MALDAGNVIECSLCHVLLRHNYSWFGGLWLLESITQCAVRH